MEESDEWRREKLHKKEGREGDWHFWIMTGMKWGGGGDEEEEGRKEEEEEE
jgi:hypothetical protein